MNLRTIIVDDERLARQELRDLLGREEGLEIVGEAGNAEEAFQVVRDTDPDLLFLDVQMPGKDGFELLQELDVPPRVIFVTAYDEYALRAFDVNALDYLLKPVEEDRLHAAIERVKKEETPLPASDPEKDESILGPDDRIFIKDGEKCWFTPLRDVRVFESEGNYVRVRFGSERPLILRSLNELEKRLDERHFFRIGRKRIINLSWVERIDPWFNGRLLVKLKEGEEVEVSRRQAARFKERLSL